MTIQEIFDTVSRLNAQLKEFNYSFTIACRYNNDSRMSVTSLHSYDELLSWLSTRIAPGASYTILNHNYRFTPAVNDNSIIADCKTGKSWFTISITGSTI